MSTTIILLSLFSRFPYIISIFLGDCVPNTQFILNGRVCRCDNIGQWSEDNCKLNLIADRRELCSPGTILWRGCNYCVCRENGLLSCSDNACSVPNTDQVHQSLNRAIDWCTPFRSYYVNCRICVCPATGRTAEARCALDTSCLKTLQPTSFDISTKRITCIPKVMYLFTCLHCMCSDDGFFTPDKCIETCPHVHKSESLKICVPGSFYKKDCNVCRCPTNGIADDRICTKASCNKLDSKHLTDLRSHNSQCAPFTLTSPRCLYCDCTAGGKADENSCFELECLRSERIIDERRITCNPAEMVPLCIECICLRHGNTLEKYCSRTCSYDEKFKVLQKLVKDSRNNDQLLDKNVPKKNPAKDVCQPNTLYSDGGKYCLCPDNGITNFNLCTNDISASTLKPNPKSFIDFDAPCEPNTFVDFDCNSCFCSKNGTIDPKWCTYDDCEAKRIVQNAHASYTPSPNIKEDLTSLECTPGSISRVKCNLCICPNNGRTKDRVCTKSICDETDDASSVSLVCEPLAYYEVDCNVCFCPRDGIKNIGRCTKNHCEKSYLRSDVCVAGQLFSDECNVCICPPNGSKEEKACTNHTCSNTAPWQKIFQLSESLINSNINNQIGEETTRHLDLCFPGEEYIVDCKLCVCPDMGLRTYATCSPMACDDGKNEDKTRIQVESLRSGNAKSANDAYANETAVQNLDRVARSAPVPLRRAEKCMTFNFTFPPYRRECTPGSMYIVRCKQCICPYMGRINKFCRPLPKDVYCEQPYPGVNYAAMGRRDDESLSDSKTSASPLSSGLLNFVTLNMSMSSTSKPSNVTSSYSADFPNNSSLFNDTKSSIQHNHTIYPCDKIGKLTDECYICECEEPGQIVEEHCFKSETDECVDKEPTFLRTLIN